MRFTILLLLAFVVSTLAGTPDSWTSVTLPSTWKDQELKTPGIGWYKCWVKIPADWKGSDVTLSLDKVHNAFEIFWDGHKIGEAGSFPPTPKDSGNDFFSFSIPEKNVKPGSVQGLAIRLHAVTPHSGFSGLAPALIQEGTAISLAGRWLFYPGDDAKIVGSLRSPSDAANTMPDSWIPFNKVQSTASLAKPDRKAFGGLKPAEALKALETLDDLHVDQVLAEPIIRQPVSISFDERGRLWVVQYLQYPHPAGMKMLSRDIWWRAVYDKVPPAPPNHFVGKDRITIHEDTDGDGIYDKHSTFVDGLNIATAAARGRGGVWVLNPPYLLFYPTKDNASRPTGDPVVHLQGFGLEDTHSVVNSLRFGPDGWLYAAQGSTVTAEVRRPGDKESIRTIGQNIWRYHPEKKKFEVFAEGGGNAFGVEIDAKGRIYSGHNGGNTRGFHYVQGGYYRKGFDKHGALSNLFAFGFFENMKHPPAARFSHTFVINEANTLPKKYRGKLIAVSPLQSEVVYSDISSNGSTFQTKDLGQVLRTKDSWFRPVDIKQGPDGAIYVADWYDGQLAHTKNHEGSLDGDTGRIYRVTAKGAKPHRPLDMNRMTSNELIDLLASDNPWTRQTALRLLGDRRSATVVPLLTKNLFAHKGQLALESLWALNLSGGFTEEIAERALDHTEPAVRSWAARLIGDEEKANPTLARALADRAAKEPDVEVRCQLAATARRLPAVDNLAIVQQLLGHEKDAADPHVPLMLWWAVEHACGQQREAVLTLLQDKSLWQNAIMRETLLPRAMRRFALAGSQKDLQTCRDLFRLAPDAAGGAILLSGLEEAFKGRSIAGLPADLMNEIAKLGGGSLVFAVRLGRADAIGKSLALIQDSKAKVEDRRELIEVLAEAKQPTCVPVLIALLDKEPTLRPSILTTLQAYSDPQIATEVLARYSKWTHDQREAAESLLVSRKEWTASWLAAIAAGKMDREAVPLATIRKMLLHRDHALDAQVRKLWGEVRGATTAQMQAEITRLSRVVGGGLGNPYSGKKLFGGRCAACHTLHSNGGQVGPDLTPFKRDDAATLLLHIVNPSAEIREGYENHVLVTESGRTITGIVLEKDAKVVVVRSADGQKVAVAKDDLAEMRVVGTSLMPEEALKGLSDQEVRDLFAYLRSTQPLRDR